MSLTLRPLRGLRPAADEGPDRQLPSTPTWRSRIALVGPDDGSRLAGLDGLRGVAVVLVVLDHSHVDRELGRIFSIGGLAGVTTFFVLSGFLITSLLLREHDLRGRIDLPAFWGRRALRLLPGLWLWLAVVTLAFWRLGWADLRFFLDELVKPVFFYYSDFAVLHRGLGPLAHTWSLAVEEQFYVVWPLLLIGMLTVAVRRPGRSGVRLLTTVLVLLTLVATWWRLAVGDQPGGDLVAQRRPDTTAMSLLAGAAVAAAVRAGWTPRARLAHLAWPAMVGMLVLARVQPVRSWLHPTNAGVMLTALALVAVCSCLAPGSRAFTSRPLRAVGAVSYGFYLWHFPLLAAYAGGVFRPFGDRPVVTAAVVLPLTLLAAYLSFVLVERPLMRRYRGRLERVRLRAAAAG